MKMFRYLMIGIIIGGLVSGGWSVWAESQVGIYAFNGTTWDRLNTVNTTEAAINTGLLAVGLQGFNASNSSWFNIRTRNTDGDGFSGLYSLQTLGFQYGYNVSSGNWDRLRTTSSTGDQIPGTSTGNLQVIAQLHVLDGAAEWDRVRGADIGDKQTNGILATGLYGFDGTNLDRLYTVAALGDSATNNILGSALYIFDGAMANYDRARSVLAGDNIDVGLLAVGLYGYDGATFDRLTMIRYTL